MNRLPSAGDRDPKEWLAALGSDWGKRVGAGEWAGPCPVCGGTDRFHVRAGNHRAAIVGCRAGCSFEALAEAVFGAVERSSAPRRPTGRQKAQSPVRADSGRFRRILAEMEIRPPQLAPVAITRGGPTLGTPGIRPDSGPSPDFARLAEAVESRLTLGPAGRKWAEGRGLDPDRLERRGWRSSESEADARTLAGMQADAGASRAWPCSRRGVLIVPCWTWDGIGETVRVRRIDGGPTLTLRGDRARLYGLTPTAEVLHVAEGESDTESLIEAGAVAVVGLPGAASLHDATVSAARETGAASCVLWFDGDSAGRKAGERLADRLAAAGIAARRWAFPEGMDCNDAWRADPKGLREAVRTMEGDYE